MEGPQRVGALAVGQGRLREGGASPGRAPGSSITTAASASVVLRASSWEPWQHVGHGPRAQPFTHTGMTKRAWRPKLTGDVGRL